MKVKTIAQFKIYEYMQNNFNLESFTIDVISDNEIKLIDKKGDYINIKYCDSKIEVR